MQLKFGTLKRGVERNAFSFRYEIFWPKWDAAARAHGAELCMHFLFNLPRIILSKRRRAARALCTCGIRHGFQRAAAKVKKGLHYLWNWSRIHAFQGLSLSLAHLPWRAPCAGRCRRRGYINIDLSRTVKHNGREFIFNIKSRRPRWTCLNLAGRVVFGVIIYIRSTSRAVCIPTLLYYIFTAARGVHEYYASIFFLYLKHTMYYVAVYSNNNIYPVCGYEFYFVVEWQVLFVCWRDAQSGSDASQLCL